MVSRAIVPSRASSQRMLSARSDSTGERFQCIIDQIDQDAFHLHGVHQDQRQIFRHVDRERNAFHTAFVKSQSPIDKIFHACGTRETVGSRGKPDKLVDQMLQARDFVEDGVDAFLNDGGDAGRRSRQPRDVARNAFRGKLDRCQRISYFMRQPSRDVAPRARSLRANDFGQVFDDEDEASGGSAGSR